MSAIKRIVSEHQLSSFFLLAYLFTWLLMLPYLGTGNEQAFGILVLAGLFGPAFANILVSRVIAPVPTENPRRKRGAAFLLSWVGATVVFTLHLQRGAELGLPVALAVSAIVGLLPAFVLASAFSKFRTVRQSLSSIVRPRGPVAWYLVALLIIPAIRLISIPIASQLDLGVVNRPAPVDGTAHLLGAIAVSFLYGLVFTGGLNEETGWSGFALPRLQAVHSPLIASIVLWFFWMLWHIPMHIAGFWNPDRQSLVYALIVGFFARLLLTWLYNETRGGILSAMLFHTSANVCFEFLPASHAQMILEAALAVLVIVVFRMGTRLPDHAPGVQGTA